MEPFKKQVTKRAAEARLRRHLAKDGLLLRRCAFTSRDWTRLGDLYVVDASMNAVVDRDLDLETSCREAGLLKPYEVMLED